MNPHPGGMPSRGGEPRMDGTPSGVRTMTTLGSGGVASLNHRLQDVMPPASERAGHSPEISFLELDAGFLEKPNQLLPERFDPVMFLLVGDVLFH